jgi:two-component system, NarL family, nitrate/nitrite response regulator NarL
MRILICDYQVIFAESLAHVLTARGERVVGIAHDFDDAVALLREQSVDVFLLDVVFGAERRLGRLAELLRAAPTTAVMLLSGQVDAELVAAARAAGVHAIGDKRQPVAEIIRLLERLHAGYRPGPSPVLSAHTVPRQRRCPANDPQRLAGFLTPRERQVLSALVCGADTKKMARSLGISSTTARCHIQSVLTKMGAHSRLEVATTAVRHRMVSPETGEWLIAVG